MKLYLMIRRVVALIIASVQFLLGLFGVSVNPMKNVIKEPNLAPQAIVADQSGSKIADKTAYAISLGIGGLMIFHMDCDLPMDHPNSLTLAIEKTLEQRVANYRAEAK